MDNSIVLFNNPQITWMFSKISDHALLLNHAQATKICGITHLILRLPAQTQTTFWYPCQHSLRISQAAEDQSSVEFMLNSLVTQLAIKPIKWFSALCSSSPSSPYSRLELILTSFRKFNFLHRSLQSNTFFQAHISEMFSPSHKLKIPLSSLLRHHPWLLQVDLSLLRLLAFRLQLTLPLQTTLLTSTLPTCTYGLLLAFTFKKKMSPVLRNRITLRLFLKQPHR